jgi:hypothetical protein
VLALALLLLSCERLGAGRAERRVPEGDWGGEHVSLQVTAKGGTLEFDCAHGTIGGELVLDASGRFDVPGVYAEERGGPVHEDAPASGLAVRYSGRVKGSTMRLTVTRTDTGSDWEPTHSLSAWSRGS